MRPCKLDQSTRSLALHNVETTTIKKIPDLTSISFTIHYDRNDDSPGLSFNWNTVQETWSASKS